MVRLLLEEDAEAYAALRREALLDSPLAFGASPEDDFARDLDVLRERMRHAPEFAIYGAFRGRLIGCAGIYRDSHAKAAHKAHLWGMYVAPAFRGQGVAGELLSAAVRHAKQLQGVMRVQLSVSSVAGAALRLYESAGFELWGTEPAALQYRGRLASQHHMALDLAATSQRERAADDA